MLRYIYKSSKLKYFVGGITSVMLNLRILSPTLSKNLLIQVLFLFMKKFSLIVLLIVLVIILVGINYSFIDGFLVRNFGNYEGGVVERVIDGDTIVVNNESVRLLGINTPERGEKYYDEAKVFLEDLILNEKIKFVFGKDRIDLYNRKLAYVIFENENVNLKLVEAGLGNCYFPLGKDNYYDECFELWENCGKNLCAKSGNVCASCVKLEKLNYKNEIVELKNICEFDCDLNDWEIKDEGRKKFYFSDFVLGAGKSVEVITGDGEDSDGKLYWENQDYVWTDSGDTLFLRDSEGGLVLWGRY